MTSTKASPKNPANDLSLAKKSERLNEILRGYGSLIVAYSGGVDSAFLVAASQRILGDRTIAITAPYLFSAEKWLVCQQIIVLLLCFVVLHR